MNDIYVDDKSDAEIAYERYTALKGIEKPWADLSDTERYIWRAVVSAVSLAQAKRGGPSRGGAP